MHLASMINKAGGIPAHGNSRQAWDDGARFDHPSSPTGHDQRSRPGAIAPHLLRGSWTIRRDLAPG